MKRRRPRRISQSGLKRHPLLTLVLVLVALAAMADRAGWLGQRPSARTVTPDDRSDVERYHQQRFRVVKVVDGDTLDVDAPDGSAPTTRVRLWGVDTPEVAGGGRGEMHYGPEASAYAKRLLTDQSVRLELVTDRKTRDRYGRLLAYVRLDNGEMFNEMLIASGHAYADPRFNHPRRDRMAQLEETARAKRVGLWNQAKPTDGPAWRQRLSSD